MTNQLLVKKIKALGNGEYDYYKVVDLIMSSCKLPCGTWARKSKEYEIMKALGDMKYGLEIITNGAIRYIGTNDLHTLVVNF